MNTFEYSAKGAISVKTEKRGKRAALEKHFEMTKKYKITSEGDFDTWCTSTENLLDFVVTCLSADGA